MSKLVGFIGAPGTGKTTLACAMKEYTLTRNISSDVCTEYAREFSFKYGISKHPYSQYRITGAQIEREDILKKGSSDYIFTDSPVWLGYVFALINMKPDFDKEIRDVLTDIYQKFVIDQIDRYYAVFHIKNSNPFDDGCRDMELNQQIADIVEGFVVSHRHLLPIIDLDIPIEDAEGRKKFVWENIEQSCIIG